MFKRSLASLALLGLVAVPAAAQDAHIWTDMRPDAVAPAGISAAHMLSAGVFELRYDYQNSRFEGLILGSADVELLDVLDVYAQSPFERTDVSHGFNVGWGVSNTVTLEVSTAWIDRTRGIINDTIFNFSESSGIGDVLLDGLFEVFGRNGIRVHANLGFRIPTGSIDEAGVNAPGDSIILPWDMQMGTGSFAIRPGFTAQIQNAKASVGAQVVSTIHLNDNDREYRWGNGLDASGWAGYVLNDVFAVNAGVRYARWGDFKGADITLNRLDDPGQDPIFSAGTRVDLPVGLNVMMPEGPLSKTLISAEFIFPVHQDYDQPRLKGDTSFRLTFSHAFGG